MRLIDLKHHIEGDQLFKTGNGTVIPETEPTILFRGRDKLALPMLEFYRELCIKDGCTNFQLLQMDEMISRFKKFAAESPTMKQPGCTLGK